MWASVFTSSLGIVHEFSASAAVTVIRNGEFVVRIVTLSVPSSPNVRVLSLIRDCESNSGFAKS